MGERIPKVHFVGNNKPKNKKLDKTKIIILSAVALVALISIIIVITKPAPTMTRVDEALSENDTAKAVSMLEALGEKGDTAAYNRLGRLYAEGDTLNKDSMLSQKYYLLSADMGNPYAQYEYGIYTFKHNAVENQSTAMKGISYLEKSANSGYDGAMYELGMIYQGEFGFAFKDDAKSFKYFLQGASRGNSLCCLMTGVCYKDGTGTQKDPQKAIEYLKKATDAGNANSAFVIFTMYYDGDGVSPNAKIANEWLSKAGDLGLPSAQLILGDQASNEGNYHVAVHWYELLSINQDADKSLHSYGLLRAGILYAAGYGHANDNTPDYNVAEKYLQQALDSGNEKAIEPLNKVKAIKGESY